MKKIFRTLFLLLIVFFTVNPSQAMTFDEAYNQSYSKPMVVLLYAQWADGAQGALQQYKLVASQMGNSYNFTEIDLAKPEAKSFNDRYHIYPKLPYAIMFRDGGKISRFIPRECATDARCLAGKLQTFLK